LATAVGAAVGTDGAEKTGNCGFAGGCGVAMAGGAGGTGDGVGARGAAVVSFAAEAVVFGAADGAGAGCFLAERAEAAGRLVACLRWAVDDGRGGVK
jgi:hypothetical protein